MDYYKRIEVEIAKKYNATAKGTRKSIGDFLINDDIRLPVNVKSSNVDNSNYSPNIISAKRLINWLQHEGNELYFLFVDYRSTANGVEIVKDSGLVAVHHLNWNCLTIEAQGWGVIQMCKSLEIDPNQDKKTFFKGMKKAYENYMAKEVKKMEKIKKMVEKF